MEHLLNQLKDLVVTSVGSWGYLAIFLLMMAESACIPFPSEVIMPVGGLLAAEGKLSLFWVVMAGAVANLVGSWIAYGLGRFGGRKLLMRYGHFLLIRRHEVEKADRWFEKYGSPAVFFSRLLPVARTFISLPAGVAEVPLWRFSVLTFAGSLPWSFGLAVAGYYLGKNWQAVLQYLHPITYAMAFLIGALTLGWFVRKLKRRGAGPVASQNGLSNAVQPIDGCKSGTRTRVAGTVESIKLTPGANTCLLEVQISDGTSRITGVWYGRRHIPGVSLGTAMVLEGTVAATPKTFQIMNPAYELLPGKAYPDAGAGQKRPGH